jgi:hypothetical protein
MARQDTSQIRVQVKHSPSVREYVIALPVGSKPHGVKVDGGALSELDEQGYRAHKAGWWLDTKADSLDVFVTKGDFELSVTR